MFMMELKQEKSECVYMRRQTSAEIVSEARRSLRALATQRPFTPQEKQRQLFGDSSSRARDGRPPSAFSLHAKHFEAPDSRPGSGTRLSPLEHKPSVSLLLDKDEGETKAVLPKPPSQTSSRPGSVGTRGRLIKAASTNRLQTTAPNTKNRSRETRNGAEKSEERKTQHCSDITATKSSSETDLHRLVKQRIPQTGASSQRGSKPDGDGSMDESVFWNSKILPVLQEFESFAPGDAVSDEIVGQLCNSCHGLHDALAERGMLGRQCKKRSTILRTLFRLVDVGSDQLNLTLAKLILALNVSGNNLLNICKLVFKISRDPSNDALFLTSSILDSLLSLLESEDVFGKGEAVLYCVASLKLLSGNSALSRLLLDKSFIAVLLGLSRRLLHGPLKTPANGHGSEAEGQDVITGHILVQVTAALRNLADHSESRPSFLSNKGFSALCLILESHRDDFDICLNVARIFSKLSTYTECCHALAETPHCSGLFLELLAKHSRKQDLVVRLLFTLGNLTAKSSEAREQVYEEDRGIDILLDLFQVYQEPLKQSQSPEREDVLIKLLRLLANLAIHPTVGTAMAAHPLCVQVLLEVIESRSVEESEEIMINAVATINNLSFYPTQSSTLRSQHAQISKLLLKPLLASSMEAVLEATRVFGNLSQIRDVRNFIMQNKVEQFVITLLDSKNPDVCFSACGVLINLSADPEHRVKLRSQETVHKLVECLRDLGSRDWHLAAVLCQTLWNCSSDGKVQESSELLEILKLYSDKEALLWPSDAGVRQVQEARWELLFLPVAERLKQRLQTQDTT